MKHLFLITILLSSTICFSQTVYVSWDANTEADLAGYQLYRSTDSTFQTNTDIFKINKDSTQFELKQLEYDVKYYLAMTAHDTAGNESDFSNILSFMVIPPDKTPPQIPSGVKIRVIVDGDRITLFKEE